MTTRAADGPDFQIRIFRDGDEAACRRCVVELQEAERAIDPRLRTGESIADAYLQEMHARCRAHAGHILVAEQGGAVVGLVMILTRVPPATLDEPAEEQAEVAELVVLQGARGGGIGRAMLQEAERIALASGATTLRIGVLRHNEPARRLYLAEGFAPYLEMLEKPLLEKPLLAKGGGPG